MALSARVPDLAALEALLRVETMFLREAAVMSGDGFAA